MDLRQLMSISATPETEAPRGRPYYEPWYYQPRDYQPPTQRRDSSASSVRSMIDDRIRMADEERGRSQYVTPPEPASPFRSGSPYEREYATSWQPSMIFKEANAMFMPLPSEYSQMPQISPIRPRHRHPQCGRRQCATFRGNDPSYAASFAGISDYVRHMRRYHKTRMRYHCPYCDETFRRGSALRLHVLGDHQCAYCENEEPYKNREDLSRHLREDHLCQGCWLFMTKDAVASHRCAAEETGVHISIETCPADPAPSLGGRTDEHHRFTTRTPSFSPPYMRPTARRSSFSAAEGYRHRRRSFSSSDEDTTSSNASPAMPVFASEQSEISQSSLSSTAQPLSFESSRAAKELATDRAQRASLPVDFGRQQSKKRRAGPAIERSYTCGICGKTFTRRTLRDNHLRTHTDERPFACSQEGCVETFKQKNEQVRHEQTKHQEKRYCCGGILTCGKRWGCGKKFARSDGLLEHQTKTQRGQTCLQQRDEG